jgi:hypothetical protein
MSMLENLLSAIVIAFVAIMLFSDRPWMASNQPVVAHVADVEIPPGELSEPENAVSMWGVHVERPRSKAEWVFDAVRGLADTAPPTGHFDQREAKLGYSVREITLLGMPFFYYRDLGHVLFTRSRWETTAMPLSDEGIEMLNRAAGRDVRDGTIFPFWKHVWGWVFVGAVALWAWLTWRHHVRAREEQGII